jgi:hypothetical protein
MPTTIYDASLLTKRKRDKSIAQQIQNANRNGTSIIIPQSGYGSYTLEEAKNGAITDYRKGCPPDVACNCLQMNQTVITTAPSNYILNVEITNLTVNIAINGSGIIDWGDGTSETFDLQDNIFVYYYLIHTYSNTGNYTINITGNIINLGTGSGGFYFSIVDYGPIGAPNPYPTTTSITINNPVGLKRLYANNSGLLQINGLDLCTDLIQLGLANNSYSFNDALTLPNLTTLILDNKPQITGNFDAQFPSTITALSFGYNTGLIGLTGLSSSLLRLGLSYSTNFTTINLNETPSLLNGKFNNTKISSLGTLPTTLTSLDISYTLITGLFDISGLSGLQGFNCSHTDIDDIGATLPITLDTLIINNTSINGTLDISLLTQLGFFNCSSTPISDIGATLPNSLYTLIINNTSINGTLDISLLTQLEFFNCSNTPISDIGATLPNSLYILTIFATSISGPLDISELSQLANFDCGQTGINLITMSTSTNITRFLANSCELTLTNIEAIGNQLTSCPNGGICNVGNQTPATGAVITNPPWSTLVTNGWTVYV